MQPEQVPFQTAWWFTGLQDYRPCDSTYCRFPYEALPPVDATLLKGEFQWLSLEEATTIRMSPYRERIAEKQAWLDEFLAEIKTTAAQLNLPLPPEFLHFMSSVPMQHQIPSPTACYFDLSPIIPSPLPNDSGSYLIRIYNDQQSVLSWYLYLRTTGEHCVVASAPFLEEYEGEEQRGEIFINYCAPTFETFIYRTWLEGRIWFAIHDDLDLGQTEHAYLDHYSAHLT